MTIDKLIRHLHWARKLYDGDLEVRVWNLKDEADSDIIQIKYVDSGLFKNPGNGHLDIYIEPIPNDDRRVI